MIYDIIHNIEKHVPQSMKETKSKVLVPTYGFITSANFVLIAISVFIVLAIILSQYANAFEQEVIDRNGIKNIVITDLNQNRTSVIFDYCYNRYTIGSVGVLVASDLDRVPVPIGTDNIKYGKCNVYGTTVLAESDVVSANIFQQSDIDTLIPSFNKKIVDLKNELASVEQKISNYNNIEYFKDKILELEKQSDLLERQIKSAQSGIKILISMMNS